MNSRWTARVLPRRRPIRSSPTRARAGSAATDLAPLFEEAVDVESVGPALHEALDRTDRLRAGRADGVRRWLRDQTREWLRVSGQARHVRDLSIDLEHDRLLRLDGVMAESAPHVVAHAPKIRESPRWTQRGPQSAGEGAEVRDRPAGL
jgi:hypothetical protein